MNDKDMIDSCQGHCLCNILRTLNSLARSDTDVVIDSEPHLIFQVQNKPLVGSIGCLCSHWRFSFFVFLSNKTGLHNQILSIELLCFVNYELFLYIRYL